LTQSGPNVWLTEVQAPLMGIGLIQVLGSLLPVDDASRTTLEVGVPASISFEALGQVVLVGPRAYRLLGEGVRLNVGANHARMASRCWWLKTRAVPALSNGAGRGSREAHNGHPDLLFRLFFAGRSGGRSTLVRPKPCSRRRRDHHTPAPAVAHRARKAPDAPS
jgi:hypothetical protein